MKELPHNQYWCPECQSWEWILPIIGNTCPHQVPPKEWERYQAGKPAQEPTDYELGFKGVPRHLGGIYGLDDESASKAYDVIGKKISDLEEEIEILRDFSSLIEDGMMWRRKAMYWREEARKLKMENKPE